MKVTATKEMKKFPFYILYSQTNLGIVIWFSWFFYWTLIVFPAYFSGAYWWKRMWIYYVKILAFKIIDVIKIILCFIHPSMGFPSGSVVKNLPTVPKMQETQVQSLSWEDPLEEGMATHSSILAWRIPWTEEPGGLQSMGSQRVRHDWSAWAQHT